MLVLFCHLSGFPRHRGGGPNRLREAAGRSFSRPADVIIPDRTAAGSAPTFIATAFASPKPHLTWKLAAMVGNDLAVRTRQGAHSSMRGASPAPG